MNCQIGVFGAYVSERGHAFIDRALYLPKNWTSKSERLKQAHVPDDVVFATKPALASMMIEQNIEAGVPCRWVAADNVYGVGDIADGDLAYFTTRCPKGATMQELVNVEGTRWRIEECFET
ncbi:transposase, partial [Acetobacter orientalis]